MYGIWQKNKQQKKVGMIMAVVVLLFVLPNNVSWSQEKDGMLKNITTAVSQDYKNFYSLQNLGKLSIGIGVAGIVANTSIDKEIQHWYQESLRSECSDDFSEGVKLCGEGRLTIPLYCGAAILGELTEHTRLGSTVGEWGRYSLRTLLVGFPPMLFLQRALGASRPEEDDSYWQPFNDDNAVSGHSFMGAVPFITAARMADNLYIKYSLYVVSTLCGLSRVNDNDHYFSQSALGWWLAYVAATNIKKTGDHTKKWVIVPLGVSHGVGAQVVIYF